SLTSPHAQSSTLLPYTTLFRSGLRGYRHLEHAVALVRKEVVGLFDTVERVAVGDHRSEVHAARSDNLHQATHALLASGTERGDRSEEHTSELQSREKLVCRLLL